jgi:hypothetical protein
MCCCQLQRRAIPYRGHHWCTERLFHSRTNTVQGEPSLSFVHALPIRFAQLCIPDDAHPNFSIYQSEIGCFAIGVALLNTSLFELCRDYGDAAGSLKFFVSTSPDRPPPEDQAGASPVWFRCLYNTSRLTAVRCRHLI